MKYLSTLEKFIENGMQDRKSENLSYRLFEDLDYSNSDNSVSFFRSDFRGSKFINVKFYKNDFNRADFITCVFNQVDFVTTEIGACEIKNCYFSNVMFTENKYNRTTIKESTFENCIFKDENILANISNCTFSNCTFSNCIFERSSTEDCLFTKCDFQNTNFATMHAECHTFEFCNLQAVSMGLHYIFSYNFYEVNFSQIRILYHGKEVPHERLYDMTTQLLDRGRIFEFINASIMLKQYNKIEEMFSYLLNEYTFENSTQRKYQISNSLKVLLYSVTKMKLSFSIVKNILSLLNDFNWNYYELIERMDYISTIDKIEYALYEGKYTDEFIYGASNNVSYITFHCETSNYDKALKASKKCLDEVYCRLNLVGGYELIESQKGSWLLTFAILTSAVLIMPRVIDNFINLRQKIKLNKTQNELYKMLLIKCNKGEKDPEDAITSISTSIKIINESKSPFAMDDIIKALSIKL